MKTIKFVRVAIILFGILLSACAAAPSNSSAPSNVGEDIAVSDVVFTGVIESISGDQWVINGQTVKVDPSVVRDGSFQVGDTIKVEAVVAADGSVSVQRVETPSAADLVEMSTSTLEASSPSVPGLQPLVFDDSGTEAFGTVESITDTSITIGGQTFTFASGVEIKGEIVAGSLVKLHFLVNTDGSLSVTEIEFADPTQIGNGNDDNSNDSNVNDDNSNDDNSNNSNDDNGNGDNSNDDNGNNDDSNDDNGGNSNDDDDDDNSNGSNNNG